MLNLKSLTDEELDSSSLLVAKDERAALVVVLQHLAEVDSRKSFSPRFETIHAYTVSHLGYDSKSAWRRVSAMRMMRELPEITPAIETGKEAERTLIAKSSDAEKLKRLDVVKPLLGDANELRLILSDADLELVRELQALLAHKIPNATISQTLSAALKLSVESVQKEKRGEHLKTRRAALEYTRSDAAKMVRTPNVNLKRRIWIRANGKCEICGSKHKLEYDHQVPWAKAVYFEPDSGFIFVSNISGEGNVKDGKGWIQKLSTSGLVLEQNWVTGLNAPKGMRAYDGTLWVTDIDSLIAIEIATGKIIIRIEKPEAKFLNDIAITSAGEVFVSDTIGRTIYVVKGNELEPFFEGDETESPNGLLIQGDRLIVAAWGLAAADWSTTTLGNLYAIDLKTKLKTAITTQPLGNLDGLELRSNGNFLVSDWGAGRVFEVSPNGRVTQILNLGEKGAADVGYDPSTDTLFVPRMVTGQVTAYKL